MVPDTSPQKILIVDDAPINIQVLNESLRDRFRIFFATSGADALKLAATVLPDLILLDVIMPDMDGYEVCRQLKADPLLMDIPIIFISAMSQQQDETIGLELGAVDYITKPFSPAIVQLRVRNQLELKRQRDLLGRLAMIDGLTGLPNRRAFDEILEREWRRAARTQSSTAVLMLDLDHFKSYNDGFGHLAGDDCLRRVGKVLAASLERAADFVARFGGEEFVAILPDTDRTGAEIIAERLRQKIGQLQIPHVSPIGIPWLTISIGGATVVAESGRDPLTLVAAADSQLYLAKQLGRNRAEIKAI
jgi:diguanylate cyclase (GGDEF)-like protein